MPHIIVQLGPCFTLRTSGGDPGDPFRDGWNWRQEPLPDDTEVAPRRARPRSRRKAMRRSRAALSPSRH